MSAIEQFLAYNFDGDADFQKGLTTLLRNAPPNHNVAYLTGQAKAFYFSKKTGMDISWDKVQAQIATANDANRDREDDEMRNSSATQPNAQDPQQLSIVEVTRLIESGQMHLIPNTRAIPEHLNEAPTSQAQAPQRRKPWEK